MKIKRVKQSKRVVAFYQRNFGMRQPFQVLVDGSFAHAALKGKMNLREQLPKYLGGEVQLLTSRCTTLELSAIGSAAYGALQIMKTYSERHCGHPVKKARSTPDCLASLIGEENPHHYIVATQDKKLRHRLRDVPGVAILLIFRNALVLEKPSEASLKKADELLESKLAGTPAEKAFIRRLKSGGEEEQSASQQQRRKRKGPNPLSCLKKKKKPSTEPQQAAPAEEKLKKKRKRLRPGQRIALQEAATLPSASASADGS